MKSVRLAASCAALALVVTACGGDDDGSGSLTAGETADPKAPVTVRVACAQGFEHVPRHLADVQGINEEMNLEVECVQVNTGPEMSAALLSGGLDVGFGNAANIAPLLDQNQDLVVFGSMRSRTYWDLIVDKDFDLPADADWETTVKALEGSRFGVVARGAAAETIARAMFKAAGVDPEKVTYIATGLPASTLAALAGDTIDAALTFEPGVSLALEEGIAVNPFSLHAGEGPEELDHPDMMFFTTREIAEGNKAALCRLRESFDEGIKIMKDESQKDLVVAETAKLLAVPEPLAQKMLERNESVVPDSSELDMAGVDKAFGLLFEGGSAKQEHTADKIAVEVC